MALTQPAWFRAMCHRHPGRLVLGIDARAGCVATDGWTQTSTQRATELAARFDDAPMAAIVYTDIATDGMLAGPNWTALAEMQAAARVPVIAAGGIASTEDVARLAAIPMAGCIIGMALYEGRLTLEEAHAAAQPTANQ
ncbi:MAG: hypothetical protein A2W31_05845 [Planctomycetes bacterium RBG_16_64_10]|nr:MAG: hypothetical protein A2W31_05845 [Planctomycetes bacterium RBG_16_64_10]